MLTLNVYRKRPPRPPAGHPRHAHPPHPRPGPAHGHAIARAIERKSEEVLQVEQGSLYPALHRLIRRGWIRAEPGTSENNRRANYYRITPKGARQLQLEHGKWERLARAIGRIMRADREENA